MLLALYQKQYIFKGVSMFSSNAGVMLYVEDVAKEKEFWSAIGFDIISEMEMMGYTSFDMKPSKDSSLTLTVFAKAFIQQVSPEVADNVPSILFESADLEALHAKVIAVTEAASQINQEPFPNFNFASPSGLYFAVKGI